jgi:hypothetical protein
MEKVMKNQRRLPILVCGIALASAFGVGCSSLFGAHDKNQSGSILDYFPSTPGLKLTYDFASQSNSSDNGKRSITFQDPTSVNGISFQLTKADAPEFADCLWRKDGEIIGASNAIVNRWSDGAFLYFFLINMPAEFEDGMDYSAGGVSYHAETGSSWESYSDCLKISFDASDNADPPWEQPKLGGTGYFYVARGIGLVHLYFQSRETGNVETFGLYKPPKQVAAHRVFGHFQDSAGNPLPNVYMAFDPYLPFGWCGKSDETGDYSFEFYYEAVTVYNRGFIAGRDDNGNGRLDNEEIKVNSNYRNFPDGDMNMGTITM